MRTGMPANSPSGSIAISIRCAAALAALLSAFGASTRAGAADHENFVLITVDTLRADHLGCYGYGRRTSVNIDDLAGRGLKFDTAFSTCSFTCPSITSIHTSRYSGLNESNFANGWEVPPVSVPTIATVLRQRGYETAAFVGNYALSETAGLSHGFATYDAKFDSAEANRGLPERTAGSLTAAVLRWLDENKDKPFFAWVHYQDPHGPYTPPESLGRSFAPATKSDRQLNLLDNIVGFGGIPSYQKLADRRDFEYYVSQYDAEIAYVDENVGKLLTRLTEFKLWQNTAVILTADHGESLGEKNFYFCHGHSISREQIHVPLLVCAPGVENGTNTVAVSTVDIAPTILELAGCAVPETFLGRSLTATQKNAKREGAFFAETSYAIGAFEEGRHFTWGKAARIAGHCENIKATNPADMGLNEAQRALYNVVDDPSWSKDTSEAEPRWRKYFEGVCQEYLSQSRAYCKRFNQPEPDEQTKAALRSLGYAN